MYLRLKFLFFRRTQEELRRTRQTLTEVSPELEALRLSKNHLGGALEEARNLRRGLDNAKSYGVEASARAEAAEALAEEERSEEWR